MHLLNYVFSSFIIYLLDHKSEALPLPYYELSLLEDPSLNCEIRCDDAPVSLQHLSAFILIIINVI